MFLILVLVERWCRLRGNLLFYFKSRDHWSEPAGVIVVENCKVEKAPGQLVSPHEATYGILLIFGTEVSSHSTNDPCPNPNNSYLSLHNNRVVSNNKQAPIYQQHLACYTETERTDWILALESASHRSTKNHLDTLRNRLRLKMTQLGLDAKTAASLENPHANVVTSPSSSSLSSISVASNLLTHSEEQHDEENRITDSRIDKAQNKANERILDAKSTVIKDICNEIPLMEMNISCDNLLCDALGRAPSCRIVIYWRNRSGLCEKTDGKTETMLGRRKSLKDTSESDSTLDKGNPNIEVAAPKNFEGVFSDTRVSQPQYQRQTSHPVWQKHSMTEIVERSSNPSFLRTTVFRKSDGIDVNLAELRISAYDLRERFTATSTLLGTSNVSMADLKKTGRIRLKLSSPNPDGRTAGFVSLNSWGFDVMKIPASTDSTPLHLASTKPCSVQNVPIANEISRIEGSIKTSCDETMQTVKMSLSGGDVMSTSVDLSCVPKSENEEKHQRRSHSLPPRAPAGHLAGRLIPNHVSLSLFFAHPNIATYQFHSGLGGDITVNEVMVESKLSFAFPQQLLSLWICEEKELVHEIAGLGELKSPWHANQMAWLENHLNLINTYSQALENLDGCKDSISFRKSTQKGEKKFEFVPTNLHLQRMWVVNDSLRKSGFYDTFTHGAFTSFGQKSPGLIKMLKELKAPQKDSHAWCSQSDRLQMSEDLLAAVRRVRREVVDCMRVLMKYAKEQDLRSTNGLSGTDHKELQNAPSTCQSDLPLQIVEDMLKKTKCLCSLIDSSMVEEVFEFLEIYRITVKPEKDEFAESVAEFMKRNRMKINLPKINCTKTGMMKPFGFGSLVTHGHGSVWQTPCTEFISKELRTPEVSDSFYANSPSNGQNDCVEDLNLDNLSGGTRGSTGNFWRSYSAYTSGYQSVDHLSDIDEFEENFKYLSVVDKTRHYYTLCNAAPPVDTPPLPGSPVSLNKQYPSTTQNMETDISDDGIGEEHNYLEEDNMFDDKEDENLDDTENIEDSESKSNDTIINTMEDTGHMGSNKGSTTMGHDTFLDNHIHVQGTECLPDAEAGKKDDQGITHDSPAGLHYRAGDEPEPIDLTHLNIEAAMMCLASKVRLICGKSESPRMSSRTFRFKETFQTACDNNVDLDIAGSIYETMQDEREFQIEDAITKPKLLNGTTSSVSNIPKKRKTTGLTDEHIYNWANELRPSMRKLRQGMDSLCKTARLICSVIRLQQKSEAVELSHAIKYRRDVCFSQALTSLVSSLMTRFWCLDPTDITFLTICRLIGPLVSFESLLSLHGEDVTIFNDMIVAVEDLRNVEFTLVVVDNKVATPAQHIKNSSKQGVSRDQNVKPSPGAIPLLECHTFPLPRVTGSRNNLKVMIPVPSYILSDMPVDEVKNLSFSITPVLFNIGINEHATLAGKFGNNGPQVS